MASVKIRGIAPASDAEVYSGNMLAGALNTNGGYAKLTRSFNFHQVVSGGSGALGLPGTPFVFNDTQAAQTIPKISGDSKAYFNELYVSGDGGSWHQVTTGWTGLGLDYDGVEPAFVDSDERLKEEIATLEQPGDKLNKIDGVTFTWGSNAPKGIVGNRDVGVLAQQVEPIVPSAIHKNSKGYLGVDYYKLIPLLIETVKAQGAKIEELERKINNA